MSGHFSRGNAQGCGSPGEVNALQFSLELPNTDTNESNVPAGVDTSDIFLGTAFEDADSTKPSRYTPNLSPTVSFEARGNSTIGQRPNLFFNGVVQTQPYAMNIALSDSELLRPPDLSDSFWPPVAPGFWDFQPSLTTNDAGHTDEISGTQSTASQLLSGMLNSSDLTPSISRKHKRSIDISQDRAEDNDLNRTVDCAQILKLIFKTIPHPTFEQVCEFATAMKLSLEDVWDVYQSVRSSPEHGAAGASSPCMGTDTEPAHTTSTKDSGYWSLTGGSTIAAPPPPKRLKTERIISEIKEKVGRPGAKDKSFKCDWAKCCMWFRRRADRDRHFKSHFPGDLECPIEDCNKRFNRKDKVKEHLRKDHPEMKLGSVSKNERGPDTDRSDGPDSTHHYDTSQGHRQGRFSMDHSQGRDGMGDSITSSNYGGHATQYRGSNDRDDEMCDLELLRQLNYSSFLGHQSFSVDFIGYLGRGAYAVVDAVRISSSAKDINMIVARKTVRVSLKRALNLSEVSHEIAAMKLLNHPNIVKLISSHVSRNRLCIDMVPVAHCDLAQYLSCQTLPLLSATKKQLGEALVDLSSALAYLHGNNVRHGDIKPENVLVDYQCKMLLADFGCARIYKASTLYAEGIPFTPKYCAPEVYRQEPLGLAADVFSLGCVFIEILTVVHSRTLTALQCFLIGSGVNVGFRYHSSLQYVQQWLELLAVDKGQEPMDYIVLDTIMGMLDEDMSKRPAADALYNRFSASQDHTWMNASRSRAIEDKVRTPLSSQSTLCENQESIDSLEKDGVLKGYERHDQKGNNFCTIKSKTDKWILNNKAFQSWVSSPTNLLWPKGKPGCGKSSLCSTFIKQMKSERADTKIYSPFRIDKSIIIMKTSRASTSGDINYDTNYDIDVKQEHEM